MIIVALIIVYFYVFWLSFLVMMSLYKAHLDKKLVGVTKWMAMPIIITATALDIISQYTAATIIFFDLPKKKEYLLTYRLRRYMNNPGNWRCRITNALCDHLLNIFDPTGNHCGRKL